MTCKDVNAKGVLIGVVIGGAVAAGMAYILTSKKGQALQSDIKDACKDVRNQVDQSLDDAEDTTETT